jgi:alpha-L-fucosidase
LLNIGPRADGTITEGQQEVLLEIGRWLAVNGEAIYGTRPWSIAGEGSQQGTAGAFTDNEETAYTAQDIRFTTKGDTLFAISLAWPETEITIQSIGNDMKVTSVELLGSTEKPEWKQTSEGLQVKYPFEKPTDYAHTLRITFAK